MKQEQEQEGGGETCKKKTSSTTNITTLRETLKPPLSNSVIRKHMWYYQPNPPSLHRSWCLNALSRHAYLVFDIDSISHSISSPHISSPSLKHAVLVIDAFPRFSDTLIFVPAISWTRRRRNANRKRRSSFRTRSPLRPTRPCTVGRWRSRYS